MFCGIAVANFLVASVAFDVFSRTVVGKQPLGHAVYEHLYYAGVQPVGTVFLLAPLLGLAAIGIWISRKNLSGAKWLFGAGALALSCLYCVGFYSSQQALQAKSWTAAALSVGLLPFLGAALLVVCSVVGMLLPQRVP
jgi:hypothetical protein